MGLKKRVNLLRVLHHGDHGLADPHQGLKAVEIAFHAEDCQHLFIPVDPCQIPGCRSIPVHRIQIRELHHLPPVCNIRKNMLVGIRNCLIARIPGYQPVHPEHVPAALSHYALVIQQGGTHGLISGKEIRNPFRLFVMVCKEKVFTFCHLICLLKNFLKMCFCSSVISVANPGAKKCAI